MVRVEEVDLVEADLLAELLHHSEQVEHEAVARHQSLVRLHAAAVSQQHYSVRVRSASAHDTE